MQTINRLNPGIKTGLTILLIGSAVLFGYETVPPGGSTFVPSSITWKDKAITPAEAGLLPVPQHVKLSANTFVIDDTWFYTQSGPGANPAATETLLAGLLEHGIRIRPATGNKMAKHTIHLNVQAGSVAIGKATDTNRVALEIQAYKLVLSPDKIIITANAPQGLFYGVQTLLQLAGATRGHALPAGEITDWPNLEVRMIYWDDAHHLEKITALKRIIRQCAFYKINAFAIKLEGHFQFKSAPAIVEPYALTPDEYQALTDYAKKYFVELVPYLDAPAHVAFILKHREYRNLRLFPDNNYQFSVTNPGTQKLLKGMFADLLAANKGGHYVLLSTDEAYYTGKNGDEVAAAKALGGNGKLLARFIREMADELHRQGRTVIFWGEYPLVPDDIPGLPAHLVNGVYSKDVAAFYRANGMRQFIYTSTQGVEPLFPNYYPSLTKDTSFQNISDRSVNRVAGLLKDISMAISENLSSFMGMIVAGWGDAGLHPETFWLGYATGTAAGWNHVDQTADSLSSRFYRSFYGPEQKDMKRVYELLSSQAVFYDNSWDEIDSDLRSPILGSHLEIFATPKSATDQAIPMLPVPAALTLAVNDSWDTANRIRLERVNDAMPYNTELMDLLEEINKTPGQKKYNIEVLNSVAALCRQNLTMLQALSQISKQLQRASVEAATKPARAVALIDSALLRVAGIKNERNKTLAFVEQVWFKDWQPLVAEANGRRFLSAVDNIKDHQPGRTIDLGYLIYRQLHYPMDAWAAGVVQARNAFAQKNGLPASSFKLDWKSYK